MTVSDHSGHGSFTHSCISALDEVNAGGHPLRRAYATIRERFDVMKKLLILGATAIVVTSLAAVPAETQARSKKVFIAIGTGGAAVLVITVAVFAFSKQLRHAEQMVAAIEAEQDAAEQGSTA